MSIRNLEVKVTYYQRGHGIRLSGIIELGFGKYGSFVVNGWTTPLAPPGEPRGSYFTSIPISPADYRKAHPKDSQAAYFRIGDNDLFIFSDWGEHYVIIAPKNVIDSLVQECITNEIPYKD